MYPETTRDFESNKILAGVGALLVAVGSFIPFTGAIGIVAIVGIILVLIGVRGLADGFKDYSIFRNTLYGFIFEVIAILCGVAAFTSLILGFLGSLTIFTRPNFGLIILVAIVLLILVLVFFVLGAVFFRQAFGALADKSGEGIFRIGGLLLLLGAVLTIILVGFVLLFVAWLLIAVGFFSMRPPGASGSAYQPQPSTPVFSQPASGQAKYCAYCGAGNRLEASFCTRCGRRLTAPENAQRT
jgi:uncharacterized membrane protein